MPRNDTPYYVTINTDGDTLEIFPTPIAIDVQPQGDYHQILYIDPRTDPTTIIRYNSLYELLNVPF